jgi:hypothetical protein
VLEIENSSARDFRFAFRPDDGLFQSRRASFDFGLALPRLGSPLLRLRERLSEYLKAPGKLCGAGMRLARLRPRLRKGWLQLCHPILRLRKDYLQFDRTFLHQCGCVVGLG